MRGKKKFVLLVWALIISGCWFRGTPTPPDWTVTPQTAYPADRYLVGVGEGATRDQAEKRAYGAVARIFSANVRAQSRDQETYSLKETNDQSSTQRTLHLDHMTQVTTSKLLENVKVLEAWHRPLDQQYFILAGLDRHQTEKLMIDRITDLDATIEEFVKQARTNFQKINRIQGYKQALALLRQRNMLNTDLRVVRPSGEGMHPPYTSQQLQHEFMDFVTHHLVISVDMEGENHEELERAIWEGLKREGLLTSAREQDAMGSAPQEDLTISGTGRIWTVDLPDPLFRYVRWCGEVQIHETESARLVGMISRSGREGHITENEARIRASKVMQEVISEEVARILTRTVFSAEPDSFPSQAIPNACP